MWLETRTRLIEILKTLAPVSGTAYTPCDFVPTGRQDYEGFVGWVRPQRSTDAPPQTPEMVTASMTWVVEITSPQIDTGWQAIREVQMCGYADALQSLFDRHRRLENTERIGLAGLSSVSASTVTFQAPRNLDGGPQQFYSVSLALTIEYQRNRC